MAEIKQYRKSELALKYFPECETKEGALSNLKSWIRGNAGSEATSNSPPPLNPVACPLARKPSPPKKSPWSFTSLVNPHQKVINDKKTYREPRRGKGSRAIPKPWWRAVSARNQLHPPLKGALGVAVFFGSFSSAVRRNEQIGGKGGYPPYLYSEYYTITFDKVE